MDVMTSKQALRKALREIKTSGRSIGFVPTMGFLHQGHLSLMRRARQENDVVVASIFVNPTQFGPGEDLGAYPRDSRRDMKLMTAEKVDIAFFPDAEGIYPAGYSTYVTVEGPMTKVLCGKSRPTHFRGVTTVVSKLFHLVTPDRAYFGQKDAQQAAVIRKMTADLDFNLEIVVCPIVRETDGLAMSSRNTYLSPSHRKQAVVLSQSLSEARQLISQGERNATAVIRRMKARISSAEDAVIDYVSVVNADTLADLETLEGKVLIALAVKFGSTRLIDNELIHL